MYTTSATAATHLLALSQVAIFPSSQRRVLDSARAHTFDAARSFPGSFNPHLYLPHRNHGMSFLTPSSSDCPWWFGRRLSPRPSAHHHVATPKP